MKIQINSLEALERLIGGDNQMEFEIRRSIVDDFTKKHLKSLLDEELIETLVREHKKEIENVLMDKKIFQDPYYRTQTVLKDEYLNLIKKEVEKQVSNSIRTTIEEIINKNNIKEELETLVKEKSNYIKTIWTEENIQYRINKAADFKLKNLIDKID